MNTSPYDTLAQYYDQALGDRETEFGYLFTLLKPIINKPKGMGLELGCGTGAIMELFPREYSLVGIDNSSGMIDIAKNKLPDNTFHLSKMEDFKLNDKFDFIYCIQDSINHVTSIEGWHKTFENVANHLKPKGVFIFDINTLYLLEKYSEQETMVFDVDDFELQITVTGISENHYDWNLKIIENPKGHEVEVTEGNIEELGVEVNVIMDLLKKSGYKTIDTFDFSSNDKKIKSISENIWFRCMLK